MGVIAALEAKGFEPGDDVEIGGIVVRARSRRRRSKLRGVDARRRRQAGLVDRRRGRGRAARSSVVARICEEVAALHRDGRRRRRRHLAARSRAGCGCSGCRVRPSGDRGAAGGVRGRPGAAVPHLRRAAARARHPDRAGAADVLRHERAHALPERAPHAREAARVADRAGDQRERHDHHRRDLASATTTSSPRRSAMLRRPPTCSCCSPTPTGCTPPTRASTPARSWSREVADLEELAALRDRHVELAARLGRDALEGRGGRDGDRGRASRP